jgi:hypothetical protein
MIYIPTTELEAVNTMLEAVGELPVNHLEERGLTDAAVARKLLFKTSRQVQNMGPRCSIETDVELIPEGVTQYVRVPTNTLNVEVRDPSKDIVLRGTRLYDRTNRTYRFDKPITVDVTFFLGFEELPEHVRNYVTIRAMRNFQRRVLGDSGLDQFTREEEAEAQAIFRRRELSNKDRSLLDGVPSRHILRRRGW